VEGFHNSKDSKDGKQTECKACQKERMSTPKMVERRKRSSWLACLKKLGVTEEWYDETFAHQLGLCAICHKPENDIKLAVDHDHVTSEVRGLLCKRCNMAIGLLGDDPQIVLNAALYLQRA
jgi:hypothetical protein